MKRKGNLVKGIVIFIFVLCLVSMVWASVPFMVIRGIEARPKHSSHSPAMRR